MMVCGEEISNKERRYDCAHSKINKTEHSAEVVWAGDRRSVGDLSSVKKAYIT